MPLLVELYDRYRELGFELLAISTDEKTDYPKVAPYAKQRNLNFTVLLDNGMEKAYNIDGLPTSVVVDKHGIVRYRLGGLDYKDELRKAEIVLNELLK
jgi:peroxiredoxin